MYRLLLYYIISYCLPHFTHSLGIFWFSWICVYRPKDISFSWSCIWGGSHVLRRAYEATVGAEVFLCL